jgi:translation elongation factor EF-Tu-like GTPase
VELYLSIHGRERYELLRELKERIVHKRDRPEKEMAKHFRMEFERMSAERESGVTGRIEFCGYL